MVSGAMFLPTNHVQATAGHMVISKTKELVHKEKVSVGGLFFYLRKLRTEMDKEMVEEE
jgi:hypothetical protein